MDKEGATTYQACYAYTATAAGTLTLTSENADAILQLGASTLEEGVATVEVAAGETVLVYVKNANGATVDVSLTFTA